MVTLTMLLYNAKIMAFYINYGGKMYSAISTACLYPLETEKSLQTLLDLGFRNFEVFINSQSEFTKDFFDLLKKKIDNYQAKINSIHLFTSGLEPYMFFSNYPRRFNDSLEQYKKYFELTNYIGAKNVTFHGDKKNYLLPIEDFCEHFLKIENAAENQGIVLGQENVARCRSGKICEVEKMKNYLGDKIHFVLDVKQALRADESPFEMAKAMGDKIICVHLSDSTKEQDCLLPGSGSFDMTKLFKILKSNGFDGQIVTEVYSSCILSLDKLVESLKVLNKTISSC